jgi:hypothetical protein
VNDCIPQITLGNKVHLIKAFNRLSTHTHQNLLYYVNNYFWVQRLFLFNWSSFIFYKIKQDKCRRLFPPEILNDAFLNRVVLCGKKQHFERFLFLQNNRVFMFFMWKQILNFVMEESQHTHTPWMFWPQKLIEKGIWVMGIDQLLHFFLIWYLTQLNYYILYLTYLIPLKKRNYNFFLNIWHIWVRFLSSVEICFLKEHTFINWTLLIM